MSLVDVLVYSGRISVLGGHGNGEANGRKNQRPERKKFHKRLNGFLRITCIQILVDFHGETESIMKAHSPSNKNMMRKITTAFLTPSAASVAKREK